MIKQIYVVVAFAGRYEDFWEQNIKAFEDQGEAHEFIKGAKALNVIKFKACKEAVEQWNVYRESNPEPVPPPMKIKFPQFTKTEQDKIGGHKAVQRIYDELRTKHEAEINVWYEKMKNYKAKWYQEYVAIMQKYDIEPMTLDAYMHNGVSYGEYESINYRIDEIPFATKS